MAEMHIPQQEADDLIAMEKHRVNDDTVDFPDIGEAIAVPLISADKRENFILDVSRGRINIKKVKYQNRVHIAIILVRLDIDGGPHRNPDGTEVPCPHLHLYREGYGDKWASPLPQNVFSITNDAQQVLQEFMSYCNVTLPPRIQARLLP